MPGPGTFFYDTEGARLGSEDRLLPVPWVKDMKVTLHGVEGEFQVVEWSYHHGHDDEDAGLKIVLQRTDGPSVYEERGLLVL